MNPSFTSRYHPRCNSRKPAACASAFALALSLCLTACAARPQSSRLTNADFDAATNAIAQSLRSSDWLTGRTADSPPIVIVIDRVDNRMDEVLSTAEQWMYVARVANSLPLTTMQRDRNIRFIIPPERHTTIPGSSLENSEGLTPTHLLAATFMSSPRGGSSENASGGMTNLRSDFYYMQYTITTLPSRAIVWQDTFEFQRQAQGRLID